MRLARRLGACVIALALARPVAAEVVSPVNGRTLVPPAPGEGYSFWIVGHSYGTGVYPVASLLLQLPEINRSGARGLALLGDTIRTPGPVQIANLRRLVAQIELPVFIAAGNHEMREHEAWEREFGDVWYGFRVGGDQWLVLYLNLNLDAVSPTQMEWFRERMRAAQADPAVRNVIVLSHHMVWAVDDPRLAAVRARLTFPPDYREGFFEPQIGPILDRASKPIYWLSGDRVAFPPFFWKDPSREVTYLATGLKDDAGDSIVELHSSPEGEVSFHLVSLSGLELGPIEQFGPDFWQAYHAGRERIVNLEEPLDLQWLRFVEVWMFVTNRRFIYGAMLSAAATTLLLGLVWAAVAWRRRA